MRNLPRVTQLERGEPDSPQADPMFLTHGLLCVSEGSGMSKNHRPIKTVIKEKEHLFTLFSFHLFSSSKRKPRRRQPGKMKIPCLSFITTPNSYSVKVT